MKSMFLASPQVRGSAARPQSALHEIAAHEWLLGTYLVLFCAMSAQRSGLRSLSTSLLLADLCVFAALVFVARSALTRGTWLAPLACRGAVVFALGATFAQLDLVLPSITRHNYDAQIFAFDLRVFGVEPALAWDRWVTPATTEWFSFFYFGYFFLIAAHVLTVTLAVREPRLRHEFVLLVTLVFGLGHLSYTLVPGFGPFRELAPAFEHRLDGPVFWRCVTHAVGAGGARTDIFPSLHTAVPTALSLFSLRHRQRKPYGALMPITVFATPQIILATMFLRWHWLADVLAGVTLAGVAYVLSSGLAAWEARRRELLRAQPAWS
jgi:hypothetical protein